MSRSSVHCERSDASLGLECHPRHATSLRGGPSPKGSFHEHVPQGATSCRQGIVLLLFVSHSQATYLQQVPVDYSYKAIPDTAVSFGDGGYSELSYPLYVSGDKVRFYLSSGISSGSLLWLKRTDLPSFVASRRVLAVSMMSRPKVCDDIHSSHLILRFCGRGHYRS